MKFCNNIKLLLTAILLAFFVLPSVAQEATDQATVRCYYLFSYKLKKGYKETLQKDTMTLDVGSRMSRYYDAGKAVKSSC